MTVSTPQTQSYTVLRPILQDNRYCNLHMSDDAVRMLEFRTEDEEMGFGVMPGWDEGEFSPSERCHGHSCEYAASHRDSAGARTAKARE